MALYFDLKKGRSMVIDCTDRIKLSLEEKSGQLARLKIESDGEVSISPQVLLKRPAIRRK